MFLGDASNGVNGFVRDAVTQAGGDLATVVAVREPLDLPGIAREAAGTRYAALGDATGEARGSSLSNTSARSSAASSSAAAQQVDRELLSRVRARLLSAFDGQLGRLDGLVIVRADPTTLTPEQAKASLAVRERAARRRRQRSASPLSASS